MASTKSSIKRIQIAKRNRFQNKYYKTSVRTLTKKFFQQLEIYKNDKDKIYPQHTLNLIYKFLDKGTKKNVFHKNMAARQKSKLAIYLKSVKKK